MTRSESINELATALAKAQSQIEGARKDSTNPHFRSSYADLSSVWEACRKALTANGLSVAQGPVSDDGRIGVSTMLMHTSGQWIQSTFSMRPAKDDPQGAGSALTYARRYALAAMVGVAPEDDDGNAASEKSSGVNPAVVTAPVGFRDWFADLISVADEGTEALQKMWKASSVTMRDHATKHASKEWEGIKTKAAKVSA